MREGAEIVAIAKQFKSQFLHNLEAAAAAARSSKQLVVEEVSICMQQLIQEGMISPITSPCVGSVNAETLSSTHELCFFLYIKKKVCWKKIKFLQMFILYHMS